MEENFLQLGYEGCIADYPIDVFEDHRLRNRVSIQWLLLYSLYQQPME